MDKDSKYFSKKKYINTSVTLNEVMQFIKEELKEGNLPKFKNRNEAELLELARVSNPLIQAKLEVVNYLAKKQLIEKRVIPDNNILS